MRELSENIMVVEYEDARKDLCKAVRSIKEGFPPALDYLVDLCSENTFLGREFEKWFNDSEIVSEVYNLDNENKIEFFENPTVDNEFAILEEEEPCRLTRSELERDYLNGPNCMIGDEVYLDSPDVNVEHLKYMQKERILKFFKISGQIKRATVKQDAKLMARIAAKFWSICFSKKATIKSSLTFEQKAGIAYLLHHTHKPNRAKQLVWGNIAKEMLITFHGTQEDRVKEEHHYPDEEEFAGAASPEDILIAREAGACV